MTSSLKVIKKWKKLSKNFGIDILKKNKWKNNSNFSGGIIINNKKIIVTLPSWIRNLKTYNIFFKTNIIYIEKIKYLTWLIIKKILMSIKNKLINISI